MDSKSFPLRKQLIRLILVSLSAPLLGACNAALSNFVKEAARPKIPLVSTVQVQSSSNMEKVSPAAGQGAGSYLGMQSSVTHSQTVTQGSFYSAQLGISGFNPAQ